MLGGNTSMAPGIQPAVSGLMNVMTKFVVPIAAAGAGWMTGTTLGTALGDWLTAFVPGLSKVDSWAQAKDKTMKIGLILGGAIVIAGGLIVAALFRSFLGAGVIGGVIARAVVCYCIGAGLHSMINGFGPAKTAVESAGGD